MRLNLLWLPQILAVYSLVGMMLLKSSDERINLDTNFAKTSLEKVNVKVKHSFASRLSFNYL